MAQLTDRVLQYLNTNDNTDTLKLAEELKEEHQKIVGAVKSLQSLGDVIEAEQLSQTRTDLTDEGKLIVDRGSHEAIVFNAVPTGESGITQPELMKAVGDVGKIGMSKALANGWIKVVKEGKVTRVVRGAESIEDRVRHVLKCISEGGESSVDTAAMVELKKRKLVILTTYSFYKIKRGAGFTVQIVKPEAELTPEMLLSGEWKKKQFKPYNFQALGIPLNSGHLHPLMKVRAEFRSILLEMGFSEMPTNRYVESSFWNFDALYVPQKHPARDAQDTFFMSQPDKCTSVPEDFMKRVKAAHTGQDYDTLGYGPVWKEEEAYKNCMRTHTTAVSARMLHAIGSKPEFKPAKLFSIDRVYRNETLDATHLAEFHQVEGVVADYNLNLGNLIGIMKEFFGRLGITKLRFKPAYNPYTEPSMEVFSYHEGLKKWVEVGNSGMFRPEMLLPMGIPEDVRVIAWGLSLERPTMIRYGIDNIRDLVGHKVDLDMVYKNPICRLDKKFEIGSDGSYLDNPLLKSPKKEKAPETSIASPSVEEPPQETAPSKNKNKKKKKKKNTENSGGGPVAVGPEQSASVSASIVPGSICPSGATSSTSTSLKTNPTESASTNKGNQNKTDCVSKTPAATPEEIAAERLKVIANHLQTPVGPSGASAKSSKKKKKSKVKNQPA